MINGDFDDFIDTLSMGEEITFIYEKQKFFIEGWCEDGQHLLALARWDPPADDFVWKASTSLPKYPVQDFINAKIFDGKSFLEIADEVRIIDF